MVADSHNDIFWIYQTKSELNTHLKQLSTNNVNKLACVYFSYNYSRDSDYILTDICDKFRWISDYNFCIPAIENAWFLTPQNIDAIIQLNPEYITLSHNADNNLCGGSNSLFGLTQWGKEVVKILQHYNIIVDTAHMSKKTFWDFVDINTMPLFNSHTGLKTWADISRNLSNEQVKMYQQSNGYIGIALYNKFWGQDNLNSQIIASNITKLIEQYGDKLFGLGTDFNGIDIYPTDILNYSDIPKLYDEFTKLKLNKHSIDNFLCNNYIDISTQPYFR